MTLRCITEHTLWLLLTLTLLIPGCQDDLGLEGKTFACTTEDQCLSGYTCVEQICHYGSSVTDAGSDGSIPDTSDTSTPDTGTPDTSTSDTGTPDAGTDIGVPQTDTLSPGSCGNASDCNDNNVCTIEDCEDNVCQFAFNTSDDINDDTISTCCDNELTCTNSLGSEVTEASCDDGLLDPSKKFHCVIKACNSGYGDLDEIFANGCEERIVYVTRTGSALGCTANSVGNNANSVDNPCQLDAVLKAIVNERIEINEEGTGEAPDEPHFVIQLQEDYELAFNEDLAGEGKTTTNNGPLKVNNITLQGSDKTIKLTRGEPGVGQGTNECVLAVTGENITIRNLIIDGSYEWGNPDTTRNYCGLRFEGVSGNTNGRPNAEGLVIQNIYGALSLNNEDPEPAVGLRIKDSVDVVIDDVIVHHVHAAWGEHNETSAGSDEGVVGPPTFGVWVSGSDNTVIRHTLIHNIMGAGFQFIVDCVNSTDDAPTELCEDTAPTDSGSIGLFVDSSDSLVVDHTSIHSIYSISGHYTLPIVPSQCADEVNGCVKKIYPTAAVFLLNSTQGSTAPILEHLSIWNVGFAPKQGQVATDFPADAFGIAVAADTENNANIHLRNSIISRIHSLKTPGNGVDEVCVDDTMCGHCLAELDINTYQWPNSNLLGDWTFGVILSDWPQNRYRRCRDQDGDVPPPKGSFFDLGVLTPEAVVNYGAFIETIKGYMKDQGIPCPSPGNPFDDFSCGTYPELRLAANSSAIDGGQTTDPFDICNEPCPNGCAVNLGAYGGTSEAVDSGFSAGNLSCESFLETTGNPTIDFPVNGCGGVCQ